MSIEKSLERIAVAFESLLGQQATTTNNVVTINPEVKPKKTTKKKAEVVEAEVLDVPISEPVEKAVYTLEDVRKSLAGYAKDHGKDATIELMIRHGADKAKPTVSSIPSEEYPRIIEDN